jgi:hypothetical protein
LAALVDTATRPVDIVKANENSPRFYPTEGEGDPPLYVLAQSWRKPKASRMDHDAHEIPPLLALETLQFRKARKISQIE